MRIHLAQGNTVGAIQEHHRYRRLLRSEFGVEPSADMTELLAVSYRHPAPKGDASVPVGASL